MSLVSTTITPQTEDLLFSNLPSSGIIAKVPNDTADYDNLSQLEWELRALEDHEVKLVRQLVLKLSETRNQLTLWRAKLADAKNVNRDVPMYRLHAETLVHIFEAGRRLPLQDDESPFPILVSQVSRQFRHVALNEPTLWASVKTCQSSTAKLWLDCYLKRSGACPLDLNITIRDEELGYSEADLESLRDKIFLHRHRFRRLSIRSWSREQMCFFLRVFSNAFVPLLERLELHVESYGHEENEPIIMFNSGAPSLSFIYLHHWRLDALQTPLSSITTLALNHSGQSMTCAAFRQVVTEMPSLGLLTLGGGAIAFEGEPVEIPSLKSFQYEFMTSETPIIGPSNLLTPALECLVLRQVDGDHLAAFVATLASNSPLSRYPCLRRFELRSWAGDLVPDNVVTGLISGLPAVEHVLFTNIQGAIFYGLCSDSPTAPLWPNLTSVSSKEMEYNALSLFCLALSHRINLGRRKLELRIPLQYIPSDRTEWLSDKVALVPYTGLQDMPSD